jgi:glycosyltransferase involved in cell wall biosynthesis/SAM-dependent methyltransferase
MPLSSKPRVLIFIVAYHAESTIQEVLHRIPAELSRYQTEILIIDDSSTDATFERARVLEKAEALPFPLTVLFNPVNQGYGGNQKIGFHYAIRQGFDVVALVHGDGQYAPERLPQLIEALLETGADAVFGSRMMEKGQALQGGMPYYKYFGNKILTSVQNWLLKSSLSEFHSGYRLYRVQSLARIPFDRNTNQFHFDTEIIVQFFRAGMSVKELPIPTYYGDEICRVNGMKYAWDVVKASLLSRAQDIGIFYQRKFDVTAEDQGGSQYQPKLNFPSTHTVALEKVKAGSRVLDIGCASGFVSRALHKKGCRVTGIDQFPVRDTAPLEKFMERNLNDANFAVDIGEFDYVLLLDVIEHLQQPEKFLDALRNGHTAGKDPTILISTGNVAFGVVRFMLFFGLFNYGVRGILDLTHTRLFTFRSLQDLLEQSGFAIEEIRGIPAPFPLAAGDNWIGRLLLKINLLLIRISKGLFSYQIFLVARPMPSLEWLLDRAHESRKQRIS